MGENHHEQEETETQQLHAIADVINDTAKQEGGAIDFAAPEEIIRNLVGCLKPEVTKRIRTKLSLNLVKSPKLDLLERFGLR